jgi:N-acylneuraminate cytidylyltransferase/CMP-N,N'-diacetyllegionaminic acid synthase
LISEDQKIWRLQIKNPRQQKKEVVILKNRKIIGIIPARAGSKGLPKKNIILLKGKPLIAWTIKCALKSKYIDKVIVSTDDPKISEISKKYGAKVPFSRPPHLATDTASSISVVIHALQKLSEAGENYDYVVLLEPTSPLREPKDIDECVEKLHRTGGSVVTVCISEASHPNFLFRKKPDQRLQRFTPKPAISYRRQDQATLLFPEGTVYCSEVKILKEKKSFYHKNTFGHEVPFWKSFEIDNEDDLKIVAALIQSNKFLK